MNDKPLPNGWRIGDLSPERTEQHLKYVAQVTEELSAIPRIKKDAPKPPEGATPEELEAFYFNQQPESTKQAILRQKDRKPSDDIDYLLRPMPACIANPDAKSFDELTAKRQLDPSDVLMERGLKSSRNSLGQSTKSSIEDRREKGIEAFTYSKPAELSDAEMWRIKSLNEIDAIVAAERPPEPVKPKRPWWKFWQRDKGEWDLFDSSTWRND